jgi:hypothetical protein
VLATGDALGEGGGVVAGVVGGGVAASADVAAGDPVAAVLLGFKAGGGVVRSGSGSGSPDPVGVVVFFAVAAGIGGSDGSTSAATACGHRVP